jgi:DNA-directed RNA polymerase subunit beta
VLDADDNEVQLLESADYEVTDFKKVLDDGGRRYNKSDEDELKGAGFSEVSQDETGAEAYSELGGESDDDDFDDFGMADDEDYGDGNADNY